MAGAEHDPIDTGATALTEAQRVEGERQRRELEANDLRHVMGGKEGRRFIWRQLEDAGIYRSSFDLNHAAMAFNEGNRNRGLKLMTDIMDVCPNYYTLMLNEHKQRQNR
jgi:hypothetical protein